ncbi:MAG TPA: transglycosylase SLT domain-containing protein [Conexibacter sp.]|jgi:soluble lytic murein transglycosylase-like protein
MRTLVVSAAATSAFATTAAALALAPAALAVTHTVEPGETLTSVAATDGLTVAELAAANGLSSEAQLIAGSALTIPVAGSGTTASASSSGETSPGMTASVPLSADAAASTSPSPSDVSSTPVSTGGSLSSQQIADVAAQHGVPGSLAAAVAWQESGFNNGMVSSTGARGVMQVMPDTWQYVQDTLGTGPLDPGDPLANVTAGSAYLGHLLSQSGDTATAIASYYQGPGSVASVGILPDTQRYVDNVLALQGRFGG